MTINQEDAVSSCPHAIEGLFAQQYAITRHLNTPMLIERERYLSALLASGQKRKFVTDKAMMLRHVVRLMKPTNPTAIRDDDIADGANRWASELISNSKSGRSRRDENFKAAARSWYRFLGIYVPPSRPYCRFRQQYEEFRVAMRDELHYLPATISSVSFPTRKFLEWISPQCEELSAITLLDVDAFISQGRAAGWSHRTVRSKCEGLRTFFRYAEQRGWSHSNLSKTIKAPILTTRTVHPPYPPWKEVQRLIGALDSAIPTQCRAKAILLLASVYGMRSCEITRLTLEDFDWYNEILTIRRAKHGRAQQFPIQFEVGQAIIDYLQKVRPLSKLRNVFLTLHSPPRPVGHLSQSMWRLLRTGIFLEMPCGLHSLRHACATELLKQGTSLRAIADLLGHRTMRSVSIYAHCDMRSLRMVADFSLRDVI